MKSKLVLLLIGFSFSASAADFTAEGLQKSMDYWSGRVDTYNQQEKEAKANNDQAGAESAHQAGTYAATQYSSALSQYSTWSGK